MEKYIIAGILMYGVVCVFLWYAGTKDCSMQIVKSV
jgi:hypothetical protein